MDKKNIVIALLSGVLIGQAGGQTMHADAPGITKYDLVESAALCGILSNSHNDPLGQCGFFAGIRSMKDYRQAARSYADALR